MSTPAQMTANLLKLAAIQGNCSPARIDAADQPCAHNSSVIQFPLPDTRRTDGVEGTATTLNNGGISLRPGIRCDNADDPYVVQHGGAPVDVARQWWTEIGFLSRKDTQDFVRRAGNVWRDIQSRYGISLPVPPPSRFKS